LCEYCVPESVSVPTGLSHDKSISVGCASRSTIGATPYKNHVMLHYALWADKFPGEFIGIRIRKANKARDTKIKAIKLEHIF
jgi:hypothetical protein